MDIRSIYQRAFSLTDYLQSPLLLGMRLYWGWQFFLTGKGKLMNLDRTTEFFASLNLPMPHLNAVMAGSVECVGGLLLMLGLASRPVSIPLTFTMIVAYLTAHSEQLGNIFASPDNFIKADPFLFLLTALTILAFGPGYFSLDNLISHLFNRPETEKNHKPDLVAVRPLV